MSLSEADTRAKYIDPALRRSDWDEANIVREYYFTDGRKLFGNKRGKQKFVDYLLKYNQANLALIEAKKIGKQPTSGLGQVIEYGQALKVRFVYATNGDQFYEFDLLEGRGDFIDRLPTPQELFTKVYQKPNPLKEKLLAEPFLIEGDMRPRYYQQLAVNKVMEAIADDKKRILLTMATGTGKTFIAFQIVHKLLKTHWNLRGQKVRPRVLFLADRNVLADQAINTFNPYEKDLLKINGEEIRKRNGRVPTNAYIFFAIYQAIAERENIGGYYTKYPKDFFDLIIIDECHRGSATEEGSWRDILDYFSGAVHVGLTATPKRDDNIDTYKYFGKPVYEYSLKEGINDGFLTPYKVKRITTNIDEYIHTSADKVVHGELTKTAYEISDFNRNIVIPQRTELIARSILDNIRPLDKTIIFCVDQDHALLMRDKINTWKTIKDPHYCVRVTSEEGQIGRTRLEEFQDNDLDIPVILTSSQMLTTGVDARNVRNIVLVRNIGSMVEFKQIVGRGTRIFEGKDFFTILDFTGATKLFYDERWDGIPEEEVDQEIEATLQGEKLPKEKKEKKIEEGVANDPGREYVRKAVVELSNGRELRITNVEIRYIDENGRPLTSQEFLEKLIGSIPDLFTDEEELRTIWSNPDTRTELLNKLGQMGFDGEQMNTLKQMFEAEDSDIFDVLSHISFDSEILSRKERSEKVRTDQDFFNSYTETQAQQFLRFILERYEQTGIEELRRDRLGELIKLNRLGTPREAGKFFGGMPGLVDAFYKIQTRIYRAG
ncbi:MAG: DEAD/DEAH box helicase family protein [Bacteroidia bacterium]|nr:DEAD/DEAH box helicase family protein [Bacteroidia bacterium]